MRKLIVAFFLLLIIIPSLGWLAGVRLNTLREKRTLAGLPELTKRNLLNKDFYRELENFFNDHLTFRGPLVTAKNWIDFSLLKTSPSKKVYIGKEGWLFLTKSLGDYLLDACDQKEQIRNLAKGFHNIEIELANHNQLFVFVIVPNKATIYPEYVGLPRPKEGCSKSRYDLLLEAFEEFPVKGFIRLDKLFIEAKKEGALYYKTGTHWNLRGERIAVEAIVRYIDKANKTKIKRPGRPDEWEKFIPVIETGKKFRVGDLADMMSLKIDEPVETIKKITYRSETTIEELMPLVYDNNDRKRFRSVSRALPGESLLPGVVIYRDSFMTGPLRILEGSFESLHALWTYDLLIEEGLDDLNSSPIVILEMVERNTDYINFTY